MVTRRRGSKAFKVRKLNAGAKYSFYLFLSHYRLLEKQRGMAQTDSLMLNTPVGSVSEPNREHREHGKLDLYLHILKRETTFVTSDMRLRDLYQSHIMIQKTLPRLPCSSRTPRF